MWSWQPQPVLTPGTTYAALSPARDHGCMPVLPLSLGWQRLFHNPMGSERWHRGSGTCLACDQPWFYRWHHIGSSEPYQVLFHSQHTSLYMIYIRHIDIYFTILDWNPASFNNKLLFFMVITVVLSVLCICLLILSILYTWHYTVSSNE